MSHSAIPHPPACTLSPYTTLFRSGHRSGGAGRNDAGRNADGDGVRGNVLADDRACAHDGVRTNGDAVENLGARAQPRALADRDAGRRAPFVEHRFRGIRQIVIAADDIAVRGDEDAGTDDDAARGKDLAVEPYVGAI